MIPPDVKYYIVPDMSSLDPSHEPYPGELVFALNDRCIYMWDGNAYLRYSYDAGDIHASSDEWAVVEPTPMSLYKKIYKRYNHDRNKS